MPRIVSLRLWVDLHYTRHSYHPLDDSLPKIWLNYQYFLCWVGMSQVHTCTHNTITILSHKLHTHATKYTNRLPSRVPRDAKRLMKLLFEHEHNEFLLEMLLLQHYCYSHIIGSQNTHINTHTTQQHNMNSAYVFNQ